MKKNRGKDLHAQDSGMSLGRTFVASRHDH